LAFCRDRCAGIFAPHLWFSGGAEDSAQVKLGPPAATPKKVVRNLFSGPSFPPGSDGLLHCKFFMGNGKISS